MDKPREETKAWFFPENHPKMDSGDWLAFLGGVLVGWFSLIFSPWILTITGPAYLYILWKKDDD